MGPQEKRHRIEAEAADWLSRLESGRADHVAFERWRDADPAHAAAFAQLDAAWSRVDRVRALRAPGVPDPDLLAPPRQAAPSRRWLLQAAGLAGLGVVGAAAAGLLLAGRASAETGIGERRAVRLPDGSLLDLNTDSRATWRFTNRTRQVWLERGEAALEVIADPEARPFFFAAAGRAVTLDPGVFNARLDVRSRDARAQILVVRGAAEFGAEPLPPGGALTLSGDKVQLEALAPEQASAATAWRRGEIVFDGDTLESAVAEYNRYLPAKIEIADPSLADIRLGGRFTTHDPSEFLASVQRAFPVNIARDAEGNTILSRDARAPHGG